MLGVVGNKVAAPDEMRGGIASHDVNGEQYILVASGWGSYADDDQ